MPPGYPPPVAAKSKGPRIVAAAFAALCLVGVGLIGVTKLHSGPHYPKQWDPRVADLVAFVENERGLDFKHPVEVVWLAEDKIGSTMLQSEPKAKKPTAKETATANDQAEQELRAIGFIGGKLDVTEASKAVGSAVVAAFYNPKTDKIYVPDVELDVVQRSIVVHELTHALQDQYVDLSDRDPAVPDLVWRGLVEGDAKTVERAYLSGEDKEDVAAAGAKQTKKSDAAFESISDQPSFLAAFSYAPYAFGEPAVDLILEEEGYDAVTKAIKAPPRTELALFDPIGYKLNKNYPIGTREPTVDGTKLRSDKLGPVALLFLLAEVTDDGTALRASFGWQDDAMVVYRNAAGKTCVSAKIETMTDGDATEVGAALQQWVDNAPAGGRTVAVTAKLVTFKGCDPGVDGQKLKNRSELALGAASSVSWIELMLVRAGAPDKVARCAALAGVSAVSFDTLNDEAGFEPLAKAVKAATPACEKG